MNSIETQVCSKRACTEMHWIDPGHFHSMFINVGHVKNEARSRGFQANQQGDEKQAVELTVHVITKYVVREENM